MYYVISVNEDGDVSLESFTEEELKKLLKEEYWGNIPIRTNTAYDLLSCSGIRIIKGKMLSKDLLP